MTIAQLLASVSLFALVVTSRPILLSDANLRDFVSASSTLQTSVQAAFRIHPGKDELTSDADRFHSRIPKQEMEYILKLGAEHAAAIASLEVSPEVQPLFDALLDNTANEQDAFETNNELVRADDAPAFSEPVVDAEQETQTNESPSAPLVVLAFSCIVAFLALTCIALTLYIAQSLRQILASKTAWELLPRFWRHPKSQKNTNTTAKWHLSGGGRPLLPTEGLNTEASIQRHELHPGDKHLYFDAISDIESEWDDLDEKYQDALDMTPLPLVHDLPLDDVPHPSHFDDSSLPSHPPDQPTTERSMPRTRELCSSPVARPAWSARAIDSPALGLSSRQGDVRVTPQPLIHPRRRAYRSPVPEFDIALAMQLRPGLGISADSAWMVRFLMAIFGWFAVAFTSNVR